MARKRLGMNFADLTTLPPFVMPDERIMEMDKVQLLTKVIMTLTEEIEHYVNHGKMRHDLIYTEDGLWFDSPDEKYLINIRLKWHEDKPVELHAEAYPIINKKGYLKENATADPIILIDSGELLF